MVSSHETEDGEPRYGRRASPEELARILAEQGIDRDGPVPDSATAVGRELEVQVVRLPPSAGGASSGTAWDSPSAAVVLGGQGEAGDGDQDEGQGRLLITIRRRRPRHRWRTLVIGLVLMLLVPFVLVSGAMRLATDTTDTTGAGAIVLGESGTVYLREGTRAMIYSGSQTQSTDCTVTSPEGTPVAEDGVDPTIPLAVAQFKASSTGTYTVQCGAATKGMIVGPPLRADRVAAATVITLGSLLCAVAGLAVTVVGLTRVVGRRPRPFPADATTGQGGPGDVGGSA